MFKVPTKGTTLYVNFPGGAPPPFTLGLNIGDRDPLLGAIPPSAQG